MPRYGRPAGPRNVEGDNTVILTNARIIDPVENRVFEGALKIENGIISNVLDTCPTLDTPGAVDCGGKYLAPGIIDIGVKICEPGERHKESFASGGRAAAAGGVTTIVTRPDTDPVIDTPEILEFVHRRAVADSPVNVLPMACLTKGRAGAEMTELAFLRDAGAVAFTDADRPVRNPRVFLRALAYAASTGALVIGHSQDAELSRGAAATSGAFATKLGLPSVSPIAERLQIMRDMAMVEATGARFHVDQVSTASGVETISRARNRNLPVTAGTSIHHLTLNEFDIHDYRTFFKIKPPLRSESDRMATVEAVAGGTIDIISSMHTPQDEESKRLPFADAASGAVALQTFLPAAMGLIHAGHLTLPQLFRAISLNPADLLGLPVGRIAPGAPADLMVFDSDAPFILDRHTLKSKSKNTPFDLRQMQGKVLRTFVAGKEVYNRETDDG